MKFLNKEKLVKNSIFYVVYYIFFALSSGTGNLNFDVNLGRQINDSALIIAIEKRLKGTVYFLADNL